MPALYVHSGRRRFVKIFILGESTGLPGGPARTCSRLAPRGRGGAEGAYPGGGLQREVFDARRTPPDGIVGVKVERLRDGWKKRAIYRPAAEQVAVKRPPHVPTS